MGSIRKKAARVLGVVLFAFLFFLIAADPAAAEEAPYSLEARFIRGLFANSAPEPSAEPPAHSPSKSPADSPADSPAGSSGIAGKESREPLPLYLAVTAIPAKEGVYLYGSKTQTAGKPTEVSVAVDGVSLSGRAYFPPAGEKADPWRAGEVSKVFEGAVTVYIPLPESALRAGTVSVRLDGLACSPVNCTPLTLFLDSTPPDAAALPAVALPGNLLPETMPPFADGRVSAGGGPAIGQAIGSAIGPVIGPAKGRLGGAPGNELDDTPDTIPGNTPGGAFGKTPGTALPPGAFIERITPEPFMTRLEVSSLGKAVLFGFFAGLILNLMPCVLPVIGIKLAALLSASGTEEERIRAFRRHQIFFSLGILAWFTCLAALFHWLDLAWGQLFQSPVVVSILALVLLFLACSIFGIFNLPLIDLKAGNTKNPSFRAFFEGFTATLLATPCGGPLLGGVLSWALMQPLGVLAVTLKSVGLGMAFPYLLLAAFPGLAKRLPRPGRWMGTLEFGIGFLLLAAVAYFVSFLPFGIFFKAAFAVALVIFWFWHWRRRMPARVFGALCIALSCLWLFRPGQDDPGGWREYTHTSFEEVLGQRMILVDFTAEWCPTCKMVEATALGEENLRKWEQEYGLVPFRVDLTYDNPEGAALLKAVGSVSIPVIAVFGKGERAFSPLILRDVVTGGQIREALAQAAK